MKINILVDSTGNIVGAARVTAPEKGTKVPEFEVGMAPSPGQSLHEVEVPDKFAKLEGADLLTKLSEEESVKKALSNVSSAGQSY